jgi:hypothetical protein
VRILAHRVAAAVALLSAMAVGCAPGPAPAAAPAPAGAPEAASETAEGVPAEASALLAFAEARLISNSMDLRFRVTAEGAFAAELEGVLRIDGHAVFLAADGGFGGAPVRLQLRAEGDSMRIVSPRGDSVASTPPQLREALVIGFTRMGILHNLARLTGGLEPDRAGGGVREWVEVQQVRLDLGAAAAGEIAVRFDIHVGGARTAEATLWFDADTGAPIRREQVVRFPGGEMRVEERYEVQF